MTGIVDYGMGNVESVFQALAFLDEPAAITSDAALLADCDRLILPGVGAFGDAMRSLRERELVAALERDVLGCRKPLLGICLGMQLLAKSSSEHGCHSGLGWIDAEIVRLSGLDIGMKVPHMGWNDVVPHGRSPLFTGLTAEQSVFYFVHSYRMVCEDLSDVAGECTHGRPFVAAVCRGNIAGTQFHPEKSQDSGLQVLKNFLAWRP